MELIQCHTWMRGYHTLSCPIVPFNLIQLSSQLWTCFSISGISFPFLTTMLRKWFKVNVVHLVVKGRIALSYGLTVLFYLMLFHLYYFGKHRHNVQDDLSKVTPPSPDDAEIGSKKLKKCKTLVDQSVHFYSLWINTHRSWPASLAQKVCKVCFENGTH